MVLVSCGCRRTPKGCRESGMNPERIRNRFRTAQFIVAPMVLLPVVRKVVAGSDPSD